MCTNMYKYINEYHYVQVYKHERQIYVTTMPDLSNLPNFPEDQY